MENNPMLGMNNAMMERILRRVAKVPQIKMNIFDVILQKPFSKAISLVCILTQLKTLQAMEIPRAVVGSNPRNFWLKTVVRPPVLAVCVWATSKMRTCTVTWTYTSIPRQKTVKHFSVNKSDKPGMMKIK